MTNPNGANGNQSDPREQIAWDFYIQSIIENRKNAYKAGIDAGYSEGSAKNITTRDWFIERLGKLKRKEMFSDSEKLLHRTIKYDHIDNDGNIKTDLLRIQTDVAKTLVSTLGKSEGYSTRIENTGADGRDLGVVILPQRNINESPLETTI